MFEWNIYRRTDERTADIDCLNLVQSKILSSGNGLILLLGTKPVLA